jgi:hypothetical protein
LAPLIAAPKMWSRIFVVTPKFPGLGELINLYDPLGNLVPERNGFNTLVQWISPREHGLLSFGV